MVEAVQYFQAKEVGELVQGALGKEAEGGLAVGNRAEEVVGVCGRGVEALGVEPGIVGGSTKRLPEEAQAVGHFLSSPDKCPLRRGCK